MELSTKLSAHVCLSLARDSDIPVGGAEAGLDAPIGVESFFEDNNSVTLWDIRVHPDLRL